MAPRALVTILVALYIAPSPTTASYSGWNTAPNAQFHIQTDEGPERYFKYQTISGQYRKEKRLEDGTVVGTYGWVDPNGCLRLRDYIADDNGYRILKSNSVYVGRNAPIGQAVARAKGRPSDCGDDLTGLLDKIDHRPVTVYTTPSPPISKIDRRPIAGYSTPSAPRVPYVEISPNSIPSSTEYPYVTSPSSLIRTPISSTEAYVPSSTPAPPSSTILPPTASAVSYVPSSTPATVLISSRPSQAYIPSPTPSIAYIPSSTPSIAYVPSSTPSPLPAIGSNALEYASKSSPFVNPYIFQNGPTYPIDRNGNTYNGQSNYIGNGYDPQFPYYDGIAVTNDGFRYYLPKHYHEEQTLPGNRRSGSFGYVDPFGIRRVIYYNTAPGAGFQHKKNNRYVGHNATPYDPRPYRK